MKICFLGDINSPHVERWVKYFIDQNHDVSLITMSSEYDITFEGISVYNVKPLNFLSSKKRTMAFILLNKFRKLVKNINPDLVHIHGIFEYGLISPYLNCYPIILSAWGSDVLIYPNKSKILKYLTSRAIRNADLLHCDGIKTMNAFKNLGSNNNKIARIYFGSDCKKYNPNNYNNNIRDKLGSKNLFMVISLRGLSPIYSVDTLIKSIPLIIKENANVKFIIVGKGKLKKDLENLAKRLSISEYVIFTGYVSDKDLPLYLASSDIYVSTSLSDAGLAASTAEAMASGLPVIVTEDPDNRYWVKNGINGYIIPTKNPKMLAKRIIELIEDKKLRHEMGLQNRKLIVEKNNYNIEMGKMEKEYEKLIMHEDFNK